MHPHETKFLWVMDVRTKCYVYEITPWSVPVWEDGEKGNDELHPPLVKDSRFLFIMSDLL